ncbi:hypothetical protein J3456_19085, partial [Sulfitobacter sp. NFXS29]|uniref:hypothetical protein n=1 Tax=Sulfitobacter sp. NFXS29 TaxID=2818438 RepID=UPI0032E02DFB
ACFNTAMICASLNRPFFIINLLRYLAEKILLLNTTIFRGDYPMTLLCVRLMSIVVFLAKLNPKTVPAREMLCAITSDKLLNA